MSMTGNIKQISTMLLSEMLNDSLLISSILYPEFSSSQSATPTSFNSNEDIPSLVLGSDLPAIQYIITGSVEEFDSEDPLAFAIFGKTPLGEASDFGPLAQYLTTQEVKAVAEALLGVSKETIEARYNPQSLAGEYFPFRGTQGELEELLIIYQELAAYYKTAAEKGNAMLLWIT